MFVKTSEVIPPEGGWRENTLYLIETSGHPDNPIHLSILWVGFLEKNGTPGNYSRIFNNTYDNPVMFRRQYYVKVLKELHQFPPHGTVLRT